MKRDGDSPYPAMVCMVCGYAGSDHDEIIVCQRMRPWSGPLEVCQRSR